MIIQFYLSLGFGKLDIIYEKLFKVQKQLPGQELLFLFSL